ncbi:MAG: heavy-metal-associated domain-containing protein [Cytophagaceae bacterium]
MKTYKLKTNINCGGCVAKIKPFLDGEKEIGKWEVDTSGPDKVLTVQTEKLEVDELKKIVGNAGFMVKGVL